MATSQPAILGDLQKYQWCVHMSRTEGADLGVIKQALKDAQADAAAQGVNLCILLGPSLATDLGIETGGDFQDYPGYESPDGSKVAKGTQEELLLWVHDADTDLIWEVQHTARSALAGHVSVARETPCFIYKNSLDLTGHIDGTGNPEPEDQQDRGIIADGEAGAGGSYCIAQRWVPDMNYWASLSLNEEENVFGRTKADSTKLDVQVPRSHLSHVELCEGATADESTAKRGEMVRRSTPYAFHDGTVGLYFMGFCKTQAPLRERMDAMYGHNDHETDAITDYSTPASGSYYFAPSVEALAAALG